MGEGRGKDKAREEMKDNIEKHGQSNCGVRVGAPWSVESTPTLHLFRDGLPTALRTNIPLDTT